jgi:hypothetical protein
MTDLLTGWLGAAIVGAAVVLALTLELVDERNSSRGTSTAGRGRAVSALTGVLVLLVIGALGATAVRLLVLGD